MTVHRRSGRPIKVLCTHNVGEGRSPIFALVKGMFTIIKKGTLDRTNDMCMHYHDLDNQ